MILYILLCNLNVIESFLFVYWVYDLRNWETDIYLSSIFVSMVEILFDLVIGKIVTEFIFFPLSYKSLYESNNFSLTPVNLKLVSGSLKRQLKQLGYRHYPQDSKYHNSDRLQGKNTKKKHFKSSKHHVYRKQMWVVV